MDREGHPGTALFGRLVVSTRLPVQWPFQLQLLVYLQLLLGQDLTYLYGMLVATP
mgnify:CR=1 FL=1